MKKLKTYKVGNMIFKVKNKTELYSKMAPWARREAVKGTLKVTKIKDIKEYRK